MVTWDDFDKIWASTSPLTPYEFSDPNYSQGWNFIGSTPPARQMWDSIQKKNDEKFKYLRDNFGTPNIVTSSSQMTDTEKVYVYMGSEAGWNSGHWYYWDGSAWADGGVYNSVAFVTDTTLSIAGQPADAKAVGDALTLKADLAGCTFTGNVNVNADFSVTGDSTLTGNVSASGDVNATGDVTADNISATTNGTIGGALSVAGASTLTGNVSAGADITVVGDVSSANIIASNNANIGGNATVTGSVASASLTTTADGTIGGNLSVSGTTALAGTSTAPTPSADDNSTNIATTEYVQTEIKPIETDVTINDKRITNIEKLLQGNLYDYQTDSSSAYTKSVPSGAMPYAGLEKVGGKTIVMNQMINLPSKTDYTKDGIIRHIDASAQTVTISGKATATGETRLFLTNDDTLPANHKILVITDTGMDIKFRIQGEYTYFYGSRITTANGNQMRDLVLNYTADTTYDATFHVMFIDLTRMFGAGNEPSTVEEFEAMFPSDWYPYNEGTLLSAGVTEVVSKKADTTTLATYPIPAEVQALEGYGWSAGTAYNYVDFERKVFVQCVNRVNMGSFTWTYNSGDQMFASQNLNEMGYKQFAVSEVANCLCEKYVTVSRNDLTNYDKVLSLSYNGNTFLNVRDSAYTDAPTFTTAMNGIYLYYELETPVETDISQYLTDDNLISVEAGGTLKFSNSNGDNYRLPVPSEEEYMIDLQEAINNG